MHFACYLEEAKLQLQMATILPLLLLWCELAYLYLRLRRPGQKQAVTDTITAIGQIEVTARSGAHDWRGQETAAQHYDRLLGVAATALLDDLWRQGYQLAASIGELKVQLWRESHLCTSVAALRRLLLVRQILALVAATVARLALGRSAAHLPRGFDAALVAMAALLLGSGDILLARYLPRGWAARSDTAGGLTAAATQWLAAHISGAGNLGLPVDKELEQLCAQEFHQGVSLLAEKRRALGEFGHAEHGKAKKQLQRCEECMPLIELFAVGLPMALLLLTPLLAAAGG